MAVPLERIWTPADALRLRLLRPFVHGLGQWGRRLVVERDLRVAVTATLACFLALIFTATLPMWMLALGPIVLGVPHVLGDVRYLVVRRGFHRRKALVVLAGGPLLAAWLDANVLAALLACIGALLVARGSAPRRALGLLVFGSLAGAAWHFGYWADVVFAHLHNLIAVVLWFLWRPRRGWLWSFPVLAYFGAYAVILSGGIDPIVEALGAYDVVFSDLDVWTHAWTLAPLAEPTWGLRLVLLFAFAQSMHYWVWLRLMPEDDRGRTTPRTFRASWRALYRDLGPWLLAGAGLVALAVALWAFWDVAQARAGYLRMAIFHGQIELVALALLLSEGRPAPVTKAEEARLERG